VNQERWQKIQYIFETVVELPEQERMAYLDQSCKGDNDLREELIAMLEADASSNNLLDQPIRESIDSFSTNNRSGERFGSYRIIKEIGSGGMGAVYLAERADGQFEQQVALKLIKPGLHSGDIINRFEHERQILAQLQHPNIAQLLDGGMSEEGMPFFSMEYVSGLPIDAYCDKHKLSIDDRIRLFMTVCQAVQFAHNNLIIHRDLKPGNIFITDDGTVKLLDFGIAKVFDKEQDTPSLTHTGTYAMTPEYAAPEQIQSRRVTTTTDVYALGLILYELLTGTRPYEFTSSSLLDIEKVITAQEPMRPSSVIKRGISQSDTAQENNFNTISQLRRISPERLKRKLNGDLDNICLMALKKEQDRRYSSAELLRQDLERYLKGLPVRARKESVNYRLQKFVSRHRLGVIAASITLLLLISVVTYYTLQLSSQRDRAVAEAQKAQVVTDFLVDLFNVVDPNEAKGHTITVREVLDRGADRIETELKDQPETQISMLDVIGKVYYSLGFYDESLVLVNKALELRKNLYGEEHPEVAKNLTGIGYIQSARAKYSQADSLLNRALEINKKFLPPDDMEFAKTYGSLAWVWNLLGDYDKADTLYRKAIEIEKKNDVPELGVSYNNLALLMHEMNRYEEAEQYFLQSLELNKKNYGEVHPELATTLYNYAQLQRDMDHIDEAVELHRQVLAMDRKLHGEEHPDIAYSLNGLASILVNTGELDEAEDLYRQALEMRRKLMGADHPDVAYNMNNLGRLLIKKQRYQEANQLFMQALEIQKKAYGSEHQAIARTLKNIGAAYYHLKDYTQSKKYLTEALNMSRRELGDRHFTTANTMMFLGKTLSANNEHDKAIDLAKKALKTGIDLLGESHSFSISNMRNLAAIYRASGNGFLADSILSKIETQ
jgi:eukaryotic-like serine/threonine-protein kinase